ncbi:solute carrier family 17 member 9-like isoform X2 [Mytilus californianus]|uniref:SLC17A9 n=1 Tax=Mytilus coruscus TaxID=42192 RepID=A0A6J8BVX4_MYTCO|nr:solute carrier family 17 member 9-like isoform X2 [Mytilus californianus]CAC5387812.1 SLC17A9 [Mytilus coruscus]
MMTIIDKKNDGKPVEGKFWTRSERKQWAFGLFLGCTVLYSCRTVTPLCVAVMAKEFDWDKTQSGSILGCFFWGYTMTQFLGGYLSDKVGGDVVVPIAACFWSILTFWTPQFAYLSTDKYVTLHILVLSRVLLGMFQGFHYPSVSSIISRKVSEHERSLTYSFICSGSHLGTLISGSIGSILLERYGWQSVFYFVGVCSILWMLGMRYILIAKHRKKYLPFIMAENLADKPIKKDKEKVPWLTLFVKPAFWGLLVGHFSHANSFFILLSWAPTYFHENYPNAKGWVFNVVPWIVSMFSSVFSGWLADHLLEKGYTVTFVRKFIETISLGGTAVGLISLSYMTTFGGALFCMAIAVACCGFHNSGILVNPQDIAPKHAGSVFGIMNMAGAIPGFVGVYMAGHILEATKSWAAVFNQTAGVCIFGCIVYLLFGTGKRII